MFSILIHLCLKDHLSSPFLLAASKVLTPKTLEKTPCPPGDQPGVRGSNFSFQKVSINYFFSLNYHQSLHYVNTYIDKKIRKFFIYGSFPILPNPAWHSRGQGFHRRDAGATAPFPPAPSRQGRGIGKSKGHYTSWVRRGQRPRLTRTPYAGWEGGLGGDCKWNSVPWPSPHKLPSLPPPYLFKTLPGGRRQTSPIRRRRCKAPGSRPAAPKTPGAAG